MMVYIASDHPLPTSSWDESHPSFYVETLSERDTLVRKQFTKPWVYYVGAHEGCGCGFVYGQYEDIEDNDAQLVAARDSRQRLADFLTAALKHQSEIELFACWDGDQAAEPELRGRMRPAGLLGDQTFLREKEFLIVSEA